MNSLLKDYANYTAGVEVKAYDADYITNRSINSVVFSDRLSASLSYNVIASYTRYTRTTHHIVSDLHYLTKEVVDTTSDTFNNLMTRGSLNYVPGDKFSLLAGWDINLDNGIGDKIEEDARIGDFAAFVSAQYTPFERITFQPGLRFIYNTKYGAPLIPSLSFHWNITPSLVYRLSYARGFRAPSLKELYMDFKDSNHDVHGNPDLKAETTNSFNTSLDYSFRRPTYSVKVEPSGFYNYGKDVIILSVTNPESNTATYDNLGKKKTMGAELNASFSHRSGVGVRAGFSRIGETYFADEEAGWTPLFFYNNYNLSTKYTLKKTRTTFNVNLKYYGETPRLASLPEEQGGGIYQVYTQPYGDLEATVTQVLWKSRLSVVVGGKNLLNHYEGVTTGYQTDQEIQLNPLYYGRVWFVKLNLKLRN
jgi:outer membrane receptor for ferrienterochelin and colicins